MLTKLLNKLCFWKKPEIIINAEFPQVLFGLFKNERNEDCVGVKFDWPDNISDNRLRELFGPFIYALQKGRFHKTIINNFVSKMHSQNRVTCCNDILNDIKELEGDKDIVINTNIAVFPSEVFNGRNPMLHGEENNNKG